MTVDLSHLFSVPTRPLLSGTFVTPAPNLSLPRLRVYIDETGDRNFRKSRQSDWFTMTAVITPEEDLADLRFMAAGLRGMVGLRAEQQLHWKEHFRARHDWRRQRASMWMSKAEKIMVIHVVLHKPSIDPAAHIRQCGSSAYNYVAKLLLERVAEAARAWPGGQRIAHVELGVVGGVDHKESSAYMHHVATHPQPNTRRTPWENLLWPIKWQQAGERDGLQIADLHSGMLHAAVQHDQRQHLVRVRHQLRTSSSGMLTGYGFKVFPPQGTQHLPNGLIHDLRMN